MSCAHDPTAPTVRRCSRGPASRAAAGHPCPGPRSLPAHGAGLQGQEGGSRMRDAEQPLLAERFSCLGKQLFSIKTCCYSARKGCWAVFTLMKTHFRTFAVPFEPEPRNPRSQSCAASSLIPRARPRHPNQPPVGCSRSRRGWHVAEAGLVCPPRRKAAQDRSPEPWLGTQGWPRSLSHRGACPGRTCLGAKRPWRGAPRGAPASRLGRQELHRPPTSRDQHGARPPPL